MITQHPLVSVCVATCNHVRYVVQCLDSVLAQQADGISLQVLVGDDCSDDGTSDLVAGIASSHPGVVTHLRHSSRLGPTANMQALMMQCTGKYIARVDGDDYWLPGKLRAQIAHLDANPGCAAVYTNAITVDEIGIRIGLFNDAGDLCLDLPTALRHGNFLNNSSVLLRNEGRSAWLDATGPILDYYTHLWLAREGNLFHLAHPLTVYRVNARGSMVANMNDHVRELYWQAIQSVPRNCVNDADFARGLADFLRRVFFRAVRTRNWRMMHMWRTRVLSAAPYGSLRMDALTAASILRMAAKIAAGRFETDADGHRVRVLYRY